jgi:hypothetical protein
MFERWNTIEKGYFDALPRAYQQIRRARTMIFDSMVKVYILFYHTKMNVFQLFFYS